MVSQAEVWGLTKELDPLAIVAWKPSRTGEASLPVVLA